VNSTQIEVWVLSTVDRARQAGHVEDSRVEAKREWPDSVERTARQLAGHANAARGDEVLWIFGLDEKTGEIVSPPQVEMANWLSQLVARFDGLAPELEANLIVPVEDHFVIAMVFRSDRAPYVVKVSNGGNVEREAPWRSGNQTMSATREQLLRLLIPTMSLPTAQMHDGMVYLNLADPNRIRWGVEVRLFLAPTSESLLAFAMHDC
jgi:hypothetical protein